MAPKKRKKRRRVVIGSKTRRNRQRLTRRKQTSSTESSSEGDEREEGEGDEGADTSMETSQSDGETHPVAVKMEPNLEVGGQRLRTKSSGSDHSVTGKKRSWVEVSETTSQEEVEEEDVVMDTKQVIPSQFRLSSKPGNQTTTSDESDLKPVSMAMLTTGDVKTHKKRKRIPYTLVEASKGNHCPTPGCDGLGHLTGMYAMHFAVSGCPKAHGKTPDQCRARRAELNRLRLKAIPPITEATTSSLETNEGHIERSARRVSRVTGGNSPPTAPPPHSHVRRSSSHVSTLYIVA